MRLQQWLLRRPREQYGAEEFGARISNIVRFVSLRWGGCGCRRYLSTFTTSVSSDQEHYNPKRPTDYQADLPCTH